MRNVKVAAVQMSCMGTTDENITKAEKMIKEAAFYGANIILLPELFERQYFCQERRYDYYSYASPVSENEAVLHFKKTAAELESAKRAAAEASSEETASDNSAATAAHS